MSDTYSQLRSSKLDVDDIRATLFAKYNISISKDDPILALLYLNKEGLEFMFDDISKTLELSKINLNYDSVQRDILNKKMDSTLRYLKDRDLQKGKINISTFEAVLYPVIFIIVGALLGVGVQMLNH